MTTLLSLLRLSGHCCSCRLVPIFRCIEIDRDTIFRETSEIRNGVTEVDGILFRCVQFVSIFSFQVPFASTLSKLEVIYLHIVVDSHCPVSSAVWHLKLIHMYIVAMVAVMDECILAPLWPKTRSNDFFKKKHCSEYFPLLLLLLDFLHLFANTKGLDSSDKIILHSHRRIMWQVIVYLDFTTYANRV